MWKALPLIFLCFPCLAADEEDWRLNRLNERYEDFYAHRKSDATYDLVRKAGAQEVSQQRQKWDAEMSRARADFVRNRKPPPDAGPFLREWSAEHDRADREEEASRRQYVEVVNRIERLERKGKHIPGYVEYDLEP